MSYSINLLFILFFAVPLFERGNTVTKTDKSHLAGENNQRPNDLSENSIKDANKGKRGLGLSAWGIILVLLAVILVGLFIYYFVLFYPILCRKEGKYDVIEHSRDTTPIPNSNNMDKIP